MSAAATAAAVSALCLLLAGTAASAPAAAPAPEGPPPGRGGTYVAPGPVPPKHLPPAPNERRPEPEPQQSEIGLSLRLGVDVPLRTSVDATVGRGAQGSPPVSPTLQATLRYLPLHETYWFMQATFLRYLYADRQQPWNPDFTYVLGYDDWHPGTYSFTYSNYSGNRFDPDPARREKRWNFANGQWSVGYKDEVAKALEPLLLVGDGDQLGCSANLNLTRRYTDLKTLSYQRHKWTASAGCRYSRPSGLYFNMTVIKYLDPAKQQPWDPDFTYGFGYFDWHPGTLSVQYNNYSGNRLPGRTHTPNQGTLRNGSVSVSWSTQW